jgi:hypothetical protein
MATTAALQAALDEAGKVAKKQRGASLRVADSLDRLIALAQGARDAAAAAAGGAGGAAALPQLQAQVAAAGLEKEMSSATRELHSGINKLGKVCAVCGCACACMLEVCMWQPPGRAAVKGAHTHNCLLLLRHTRRTQHPG